MILRRTYGRGSKYDIYRGQRMQRGHGLGSIFAKLFRMLVPIGKKLIKKGVESKLVKSAVKEAGKSLLKTGMHTASDIIEGQPKEITKANLKENVKKGRKRIAESMRGNLKGMGKRRKKALRHALFEYA